MKRVSGSVAHPIFAELTATQLVVGGRQRYQGPQCCALAPRGRLDGKPLVVGEIPGGEDIGTHAAVGAVRGDGLHHRQPGSFDLRPGGDAHNGGLGMKSRGDEERGCGGFLVRSRIGKDSLPVAARSLLVRESLEKASRRLDEVAGAGVVNEREQVKQSENRPAETAAPRDRVIATQVRSRTTAPSRWGT